MKPEEKAREEIDNRLARSGWNVQDRNNVNLFASRGVAVREVSVLSRGEVDYLLFADGKAIGTLEAKPEGWTLRGVESQSAKYSGGMVGGFPTWGNPLPFAYESTGAETHFTNRRDEDSRSREVFAFHRPETLIEWAKSQNTLYERMQNLPALSREGLWPAQFKAVSNLEKSLAQNRPRALIQMATGSGKTFTAVNIAYRLIRYANARRILFLVDRANLGRQTLKEFQQFRAPDDGRLFSELYNIQLLQSNRLDLVSRVCITTIQRLYSMLKGEAELAPDLDEQSIFETPDALTKEPLPVAYNPALPIETFDFIIVDECHRSIYNLWRQALEYFDAYLIGLTATPSKQTFGFFNQNLVMEYNHEQAVADGVNVNYDVYRIRTEITESGSRVEAGFYVDKRHKLTRRRRWEQLDEEFAYAANQLDREVVAPDQIRTVVRAFRDKLFTEIFPGRTDVPKTLIYAKDDSHADDIVDIVRQEFGKGNEFCQKITYKTTGIKTDDLISAFRNNYYPRIVVTVDMIATGTDIKPLEIVLFMRSVKSRTFFEQMKGRGVRVISETEFRAVTPDARDKTHFVIVDAVGVCERDKTDSRPLERKRNVSFEKLMEAVAFGNRQESVLTSLAGRLARFDRELRNEERDYEPASELLQRILIERRARWEADYLARMKAQGKEPTDDKWREKYKEPDSVVSDDLPKFPSGWKWTNVIQLGFVVSGQTPKGIDQVSGDGNIPWFRVGDMNTIGNEKMMYQAEVYLTNEEALRLKINIQPAGTIIFPKRGGAIATNKKRILTVPSAYDLNTMGICPIDTVAEYFNVWFLGIDLGKLSDGSNVPQINHDDIELLEVPLPPLAEQRRIVEEVEKRLSAVDELEGIISASIERAEDLRRAILKRAFEGRLAPQDPNDEPASVLLERIRAERDVREAESKAKKKGGKANARCFAQPALI